MKAKIQLNRAQREMVINAMKTFRLTLEGISQKQFDIAYNKVLAMTNVVYLDGMEMIYTVRALRRRGKLFWAIRKYEEYKHYNELASLLEQTRIEFQLSNKPKIKNAACAVTQTA